MECWCYEVLGSKISPCVLEAQSCAWNLHHFFSCISAKLHQAHQIGLQHRFCSPHLRSWTLQHWPSWERQSTGFWYRYSNILTFAMPKMWRQALNSASWIKTDTQWQSSIREVIVFWAGRGPEVPFWFNLGRTRGNLLLRLADQRSASRIIAWHVNHFVIINFLQVQCWAFFNNTLVGQALKDHDPRHRL